MAEKRVNIWMNHWFSTAYNIIDLIKKDEALDFNIIIMYNENVKCGSETKAAITLN